MVRSRRVLERLRQSASASGTARRGPRLRTRAGARCSRVGATRVRASVHLVDGEERLSLDPARECESRMLSLRREERLNSRELLCLGRREEEVLRGTRPGRRCAAFSPPQIRSERRSSPMPRPRSLSDFAVSMVIRRPIADNCWRRAWLKAVCILRIADVRTTDDDSPCVPSGEPARGAEVGPRAGRAASRRTRGCSAWRRRVAGSPCASARARLDERAAVERVLHRAAHSDVGEERSVDVEGEVLDPVGWRQRDSDCRAARAACVSGVSVACWDSKK